MNRRTPAEAAVWHAENHDGYQAPDCGYCRAVRLEREWNEWLQDYARRVREYIAESPFPHPKGAEKVE